MLFDSFELVILDIEGTGAARCTAASGMNRFDFELFPENR